MNLSIEANVLASIVTLPNPPALYAALFWKVIMFLLTLTHERSQEKLSSRRHWRLVRQCWPFCTGSKLPVAPRDRWSTCFRGGQGAIWKHGVKYNIIPLPKGGRQAQSGWRGDFDV